MDGWKREGGKGLHPWPMEWAGGWGGGGGRRLWLDDQTLLDVVQHRPRRLPLLFDGWKREGGKELAPMANGAVCMCASACVCVCARARARVCVVCKWTSGYSWMTRLCRMCGSTSATLPSLVSAFNSPPLYGRLEEGMVLSVCACICMCMGGGGRGEMLDDQTLPDVWFNIGHVDLVSRFLSSLQTAGRGNDA